MSFFDFRTSDFHWLIVVLADNRSWYRAHTVFTDESTTSLISVENGTNTRAHLHIYMLLLFVPSYLGWFGC